MEGLNKNQYNAIFWSVSDRFGAQAINFLISIVLTRLLTPEEFGLIGMIMIFMALGQTLIDSGLTSSLIRTRDCKDSDYSVVFFSNIFFSVLFYCLMYFLAPWIALFFEESRLITLIRVYSIGYVIIAFSSVHQTLLVKNLKFKDLTKVRIPSAILAGIFSIFLAYKGFGVWSLVAFFLANQSLLAIFFWITNRLFFPLSFTWARFEYHFSFGYRLTLAGILNTLFEHLYQVLIGKFFSVVTLGYYTRAYTLKQYPIETLASALQKVTYPLFAQQQRNPELMRNSFRELVTRVIFIVAPMMVLGAALAESLIWVLFGEDWMEVVPFFQVLCISGILYPIHSYNLNILNVFGRSDLFLRLEVVKKIQVVVVVLIAFRFGVMGLVWAQVVTSFTSLFINSFYTSKFVGYGFKDQLADIFPAIAIASVLGLGIWISSEYLLYKILPPISFLILFSILGIIAYFMITLILGFATPKIILQKVQDRF